MEGGKMCVCVREREREGESCTIKIAECQRIDAFELWCWRRLLTVLNGHEVEQTLGDGEGQGSLACCSLWS